MVRRLLRRPEAALFVLVFSAYAYFYQAGGWNQNSRFDLVRAIVEEHSSVIDRYRRNTGDLACRGPRGRCVRVNPARGDHAYCDKAPGASWLAVPAYAIAHLGWGGERPSPRYLNSAAYLSTIWAVGLPAAIAVVMLFVLLGALGVRDGPRTAVSLAYALATLAFPYATLFYGHQLMTALVVIGFAMLVRARHTGWELGRGALIGVGLLLGYAVVVEYPAALAVAPICVYAALFVRPWPRLGWLACGMAIPALALAIYQWTVFGGPATLPYEFSTQGHRSQGFFMGLGMPSPIIMGKLLFGSFRGLFYSAPWLLLAIPGGVMLWRRGFRAELGVCAAVFLLYLWLNSSLVDWQGGWAMGPRYLIPAIPFLAIAAAGLGLGRAGAIEKRSPPRATLALWGLGLVAVAYSAFLMLVGTAVKPEVDVRIAKPFGRFLLERFYAGDLAVNRQSIDAIAPGRSGAPHSFNLGQLIGLDGLLSLLPLALLTAVAGYWLWRTLRVSAAGAD